MENRTLQVFVAWDADAGVWHTTGSTVPGLVAEATTLDALRQQSIERIAELLPLNMPLDFDFNQPATIQFIAAETVQLPHCA